MLPMYAHGLSLMEPPTPPCVRKVATLSDGSQLPNILTAVRPTSNTQESCEEGVQVEEMMWKARAPAWSTHSEASISNIFCQQPLHRQRLLEQCAC